jgi:hypothetical protein
MTEDWTDTAGRDEWYATDAVGHVAVFSAAEGGARPRELPLRIELTEFLRRLKSGHLSEQEEETLRYYYDETLVLAADAGLYVYELFRTNIHFLDPYNRTYAPAAPRRVEELPPRLRRIALEVRLDRVQFGDSPCLQPVELLACEAEDLVVGYLTADGRRMRPFPGREAAYRAYCLPRRESLQLQRKGVDFEGLEESSNPAKEQ